MMPWMFHLWGANTVMCSCVWQRERESLCVRERERERELFFPPHAISRSPTSSYRSLQLLSDLTWPDPPTVPRRSKGHPSPPAPHLSCWPVNTILLRKFQTIMMTSEMMTSLFLKIQKFQGIRRKSSPLRITSTIFFVNPNISKYTNTTPDARDCSCSAKRNLIKSSQKQNST